MQAFDSQSTNVAAGQMRNALNNLADTVKDPATKKVRFTPRMRQLSSLGTDRWLGSKENDDKRMEKRSSG